MIRRLFRTPGLIVASGIILIVMAAYAAIFLKSSSKDTQTVVPSTKLSPRIPAAGESTYTNDTYSFSFQYPFTDQLDNDQTFTQSFPTELASGLQVVAVDGFENQDSSGSLFISVGTTSSDVSSCFAVPTSDESTVNNVAVKAIGSQPFKYYETWSAGTGQLSVDHVYKTLYNNACYAFDESITGPDQKLSSPAIVELFALMDAVVRSVRIANEPRI